MRSRACRLAVAGAGAVLLTTMTPAPLDATTLAIMRSGNQIILAADSLMTLYGKRPQLTCKIRRHGDVVFATAGLIVTSDGSLEFHDVITTILRRQLPWGEQADQVEEWLREPLLRALRRMEREFPDEFQAQLQQSFVLHLSLAGVNDGGPILEMREFFVDRHPDGALRLQVERFSCPDSCPDTPEVLGVGETDEMMRLVTELRGLPSDVAGLAHELVAKEIERHPEHVGPPVDIVRLSPGGIDWVTLKPACQS